MTNRPHQLNFKTQICVALHCVGVLGSTPVTSNVRMDSDHPQSNYGGLLSVNIATRSSILIAVSSGPQTVRLTCLVLGEPSGDRFHINIAQSETVGRLKDLIKEKQRPAFDAIPANRLKLWNVSCLTSRSSTSMLTV
jgi:hypothetical protein